jgi:hypothetical protein
MDTKKEKVVVAVSLECKHTSNNKVFVTRIRKLGLTAYGTSNDESTHKVKRMFATYVQLHRKYGTLEKQLNKSGLQWWKESEYNGTRPVEVLNADGTIETRVPEIQDENSWQETRELVMAY